MRKLNLLFFFSLMLLLFAGSANAAFDNSHHDMRGYYGPGTESQSCFHCHGRTSTVVISSTDNNWGAVGALCLARCHQGTGGLIGDINGVVPTPPPSVDPAAYNVPAAIKTPTIVYFPNSHRRNPANLHDGTGASVAWPPTPNPNWPYVKASTQLECTSCHAVHDNQYPPFIWAPMYSTGTRNSFCSQCHVERATLGTDTFGAPNGMHPVDFLVNGANSTGRTGNNRHGRRIWIQTYGSPATNIFDVPNVAASALVGLGGAASWATGGHVTRNATGAMLAWDNAAQQQMGCYTCHSAHRTNIVGESEIVNVVTRDPANGWNPICVGCHGGATTNAADRAEFQVGSVTIFGHPVGTNTGIAGGTYVPGGANTYRDSMGLFTFQVTSRLAAGQNEWGNNGQVMCTSCHKVHYGASNSMILAQLGQGTSGAAICKRCHSGVGFPNQNDASKPTPGAEPANTHHRTALTVVAGSQGSPSAHTPVNESQALAIQNPSWANTTTGLGNINGNPMDCADCHTFPAAGGTAHNW